MIFGLTTANSLPIIRQPHPDITFPARPVFTTGRPSLVNTTRLWVVNMWAAFDSLTQLGIGWASLAILHIIVALTLGTRFPSFISTNSTTSKQDFVQPIVISGYVIAALALFPSLFLFDSDGLVYALASR